MSEVNFQAGRRVYYAGLCLSIAFGIAGQLLMKWAALQMASSNSIGIALAQIILALAIYTIGILSWIFALRRVRLSIAYSLSSLNYVGILLGSYYWFGERIGMLQIAGVALIFTGVALIILRART